MAIEGFDLAVKALAEASDITDLMHALEDCGQLRRLDRSVMPTMGILESDRLKAVRRLANADSAARP